MATYAYPELPVKLAFQGSEAAASMGFLFEKWFAFSNYLQATNPAEYLGFLVVFFGLAVAGLLTCIKGR